MFNRRGFIGSLIGLMAWSKGSNAKSLSPAASAIQPTCGTDTRKYLLESGGQTIFSVIGADGGLVNDQVIYVEHEVNGKRYIEVGSIPISSSVAEMMKVIPVLPTKGMEGITNYAMGQAFAHKGRLVPVGLIQASRSPGFGIPYYRTNGDSYLGLKRSA